MKYGPADIAFSRYIRKRDADAQGNCTCPLCLYQDHWQDFSCGHYIKRRHLSTRWCEDNAFAICPACNFMMEGSTPLLGRYGKWITMEIGPERWKNLMQLKMNGEKFSQRTVNEIAKYYREKFKSLARVK